MCTVVTWGDNEIIVASSRNMDWFSDMETRLWVVPAGQERIAAAQSDPNPLKWTSKYGSVIASVYNIGAADGMNEKGLMANLLWLADTQYAKTRDDAKPALAVSLWAQYYLDNFASVAEAVADFGANPYQVIPASIAGQSATVHLRIADATGDVAVFEILDGEMVIHQGKEYTVLTNSPIFSVQLENLKQYEGFGGTKPLPGTTEAADRFVRAAYYSQHLREPKNAEMVLAELLSVLRNVAQPYATPDQAKPNEAPTIWRTIADHSRLKYFFESTSNPYLVWLDFDKQDFSAGAPVKMLDLPAMTDRIGEQSAGLVESKLFEFSVPANS